jgi:hypothetical protein
MMIAEQNNVIGFRTARRTFSSCNLKARKVAKLRELLAQITPALFSADLQ